MGGYAPPCTCGKYDDFLNWVHHIHFHEKDRVDHCVAG